MNILKANRAINPSKINLSGEMLHFYFRAQSRLRHGLRPRSALRADPAGGGSFPPTRPPTRPADTRGSCTPPPAPQPSAQHRAHGHRKGACVISCPRGKRPPHLKGRGDNLPQSRSWKRPVSGVPRGQCVGTYTRTHTPPPAIPGRRGPPPRPAELRSLLFHRQGSRGGGGSAWESRGLGFAGLPGLGCKPGCVPGRRGRVRRAASPARSLAASPRRRISTIPHPA